MANETAKGADYVIIGAGSAGATLANRLSADPSVSVALLEAGPRDSNPMIRMPAAVGGLLKQKNAYNWGFHTEPQKHLEGRRLFWPRGRGWGGSSSINGMIYIRGHKGDYDQWAQLGLRGWSYDDVLPYFKRSEAHEQGGDAFHGGDGPLKVTDSPLDNPMYKAFIDAGQAAGHPLCLDFNGAEQTGVGPYQRTIHDGARWSTAAAYLHPALDRENLSIVSNAHVTQIDFENGKAVGVSFAKKRGGRVQSIRADAEVILCAGAVQSPQILMLSGIGPAEDLRRHGIDVVHASKDVGQNLPDHLDATVINYCTQKTTAYSTQAGLKKIGVAWDYFTARKGPGRDNFLQAGAFLNSREGLSQPDLQFHYVNGIVIEHAQVQIDRDGFTVHVCQVRPESRGTIALRSADPFDDPTIDPNYLATEEDRRAIREGIKMGREIVAQGPFDPYRGDEHFPGRDVKTDDDIDAYVRRTAETIYHPVGACRMGIDPDAVVDGDLRVNGVEGVRVVDASVMPTLVSGNTNAPTIMIAEKAADLIVGKAALKQTALLSG